MKNFIGKIFAVWSIIAFLLFLVPAALILWIIGLVPEPRRTKIFQIVVKIWMSTWLFLIGCRLKIKGKKNFKKGENYIVTCNHNSFMDVVAITPFIPGPNKTIAKIEMSKIPIFGLVYMRGSVLVDRKNKNSRKESFSKMKHVLDLGMHMCIYPEGTRNKTELPLADFKDGAFKLAIDTGHDILPAVAFNTKNIMPADKGFYVWPGTMHLHFLPPVSVAGETSESLKAKIYEITLAYYQQHYAQLTKN